MNVREASYSCLSVRTARVVLTDGSNGYPLGSPTTPTLSVNPQSQQPKAQHARHHEPFRGRSSHARALEGVNPFKTADIRGLPKVIFPSRQPCIEGEMTFSDPFEDSGVVSKPTEERHPGG